MEKMEKDGNWKARDSSPVNTKQKNDIGVRNQTTKKSAVRFPLVTIIAIILVLIIVGFYLSLGTGN